MVPDETKLEINVRVLLISERLNRKRRQQGEKMESIYK
jgi:hypothetical protein